MGLPYQVNLVHRVDDDRDDCGYFWCAHTQANPGRLVMGRKFGALGNALAEAEEKQWRGESGLSPF